MHRLIRFALLLTSLTTGCQQKPQFRLLSPDESGIQFGNALTIRDTLNILDNEMIYNGAGVAVGDWNGDSLPDIFFTANMEDNALYVNRGKLKFEDVTKSAGVSKPRPCWSAGATVVDINTDGRLDLYVSNMLYGLAESRRNLLYVNQGNDANGVPTFREMAADYGLDNHSHSAQTVFFDYDLDGDLDAYILVNQIDMQYANQYLSKPFRQNSPTADRLLRNDFDSKRGHAFFTDVSTQAGIEAQGYGHGVSVADFNDDGWPDLYVTNDYLSNDNLFINQGGRGQRITVGQGLSSPSSLSSPFSPIFIDRIHDCMKHLSWSAMGNDVADVNNDGRLDVLATDMLPDYNERKKALLRANNYAHYQFTEQYGYEYQHIRNTLQLNRGIDPQTGLPRFSEISQLAGVPETDWSWCPLWFDADNDGFRDLLITNGFPKDITDQDFLAYRNDVAAVNTSKADLYRMIPEVRIPNYVFRNNGRGASGQDSLTFTDKTRDWGFEQPTFSNGAAYADFDRDGDLDVIVNNTNDYAYLYENQLNKLNDAPDYLRIQLVGSAQNPLGIGAKVTLFSQGQTLYAEQSIVRGYLSTSEPTLHFGLGQKTRPIDSVQVVWPAAGTETARLQTLRRVMPNQTLRLVRDRATGRVEPPTAPPTLLETLPTAPLGLSFTPPESDFIDFNIQKTLPHKFSAQGPQVTVGDINGDGRDDFYVAGSSRFEGTFFIQQADGQFVKNQQALKTLSDKKEEDTGVLLFDADGDKDLDLYCVRGSYQHEANSPYLQDGLFVNDGRGRFTRDSLALPRETANGRVVRAADFDRDGDLDLFVGGNVTPRTYPKSDRSFLLRNNSRELWRRKSEIGVREKQSSSHRPLFTDVTAQIAPGLLNPGIINDALWTDPDRDGWPDLLLAGEWMPLTLLTNQRGRKLVDAHWSLSSATGWWTSLCGADFDGDGDTDYVAGNYGLNTAYHASPQEPLMVCADDFDKNGTYDALLAHYDNRADGQRKQVAFNTRDDLIKQSLLFRRRFLTYADFGKATWADLLTPDEARKALLRAVKTLASVYIENLGNGQFASRSLPMMAQISPITGMLARDLNGDHRPDLLLVGNDFGMETFQGQADAGQGLVLLNTGRGPMAPMDMARSGFIVSGDARALVSLQLVNGRVAMLATQNRGPLLLFSPR